MTRTKNSGIAKTAAGALIYAWAAAAAWADDAQTPPEPPVSLSAVYTGETWHALRGGVSRGSSYLDNLDVQFKVDGSSWGLPGTSAYAYVLYNNGREFAPYTGSQQGISNIEAVPSTRLYEAWVETPALGGNLRMGLYNLNTEFDANEVGAMFLSPSHGIGPEFAHTGLAGPSIFPVTSLALRYKREAGDWRMQAVVMDGVPGDPKDPRRTYIHLGGGDGALLVGEVGKDIGGINTSVGLWHYTTTMTDITADPDAPDAPQHNGSTGGYALFSGSLWNEDASGRDISAFLRFGVGDADVYQTHHYLGVGVVSTGPSASRSKDRLGLALAVAENSDRFRAAQFAAGTPFDAREVDVELSYRAVLTDWLILQPDLRYIVNPGTDPALDNAWVMGLRFQLAVGWPH